MTYYAWIEVKLFSRPDFWTTTYNWWQFYSVGYKSELIMDNFSDHLRSKSNLQYLWYPLPVLAMTESAIQVVTPSIDFTYQDKKIDHFGVRKSSMWQAPIWRAPYYQYENPNYYQDLNFYIWINASDEIRPHPNPQPCTQCGWYCNQTC